MPKKNSQQKLESTVKTLTVENINKAVNEIDDRSKLDFNDPKAVDNLAGTYGLNSHMLTQESNAKAIKGKQQYLTGISTTINKIISKETNQDIVEKLDKVQSAIPKTLRVQPTWLQVISRAILFVFNKLMRASPKSNASQEDPLAKDFSTNPTGVNPQNTHSLERCQFEPRKASNITPPTSETPTKRTSGPGYGG